MSVLVYYLILTTFYLHQADVLIKAARSVRRKVAAFLLEKFFTEETEEQPRVPAENNNESIEG